MKMSIATNKTVALTVNTVTVCLLLFCTAEASSATPDAARETPPVSAATTESSQTLSLKGSSPARTHDSPGVPHGSATTKSTDGKAPVTLQNIRSVLHGELEETNSLLRSVDQKVSPRGFLETVASEAPSKIFWDILVIPSVSWLLAALVPLLIVSKLAVLQRLRKARQEGRTSPFAESADTVVTVFSYALLILFGAVFVMIASTSNAAYQASSTTIPDIADRLTRIEEMLSSMQAVPRKLAINANPILFVVTICSLLWLIVTALTRSKKDILLWSAPLAPTSKSDLGNTGKLLVAPVVLALIMLLLPYLATALFLPFILSHFIAATLDMLHVYPNPGILRIVLRRYSVLIYLSYYGAWSGFLSAIRELSSPFLVVILDTALTDHQTTQIIVEHISQWTPMLMVLIAAIAALPGWRQVRRAVAIDRIPALREELNAQEAAMNRKKEVSELKDSASQ